MRAYQWLAAGAILAAFAAPVRAQGGTAVAPGSNTSQNITYTIVNPSASSTSIAPPQTVDNGFSLVSMFHWPWTTSGISSTPLTGTSNFPAPSSMPGPSYLQGFGYTNYAPQPVQPGAGGGWFSRWFGL
jgi:hypothetical protein